MVTTLHDKTLLVMVTTLRDKTLVMVTTLLACPPPKGLWKPGAREIPRLGSDDAHQEMECQYLAMLLPRSCHALAGLLP